MISSKASDVCQGEVLQQSWGRVFFGNRNFSPHLDQKDLAGGCFLNQVHGNQVVEAHPHKVLTADGQWTRESGRPLWIKTADCLPVFLFDPSQRKAFALHIGWRGLATKILSAALKKTQAPDQVQMWIGPHIHQEDFFLRSENLEVLKSKHSYAVKFVKPSCLAPYQHSVDLKAILCEEAKTLGILDGAIWTSSTNTYRSPEHHSHRRFPGNKGRQYACIEIKD